VVAQEQQVGFELPTSKQHSWCIQPRPG